MLAYSYADSPVGRLLLAGDGATLQLIGFPSGNRAKRPASDWHRDDGPFEWQAAEQKKIEGVCHTDGQYIRCDQIEPVNTRRVVSKGARPCVRVRNTSSEAASVLISSSLIACHAA